MQFKFLFAMVMAFALSLGAIAQQTDDGIKQDTKDAAHSTGRAAKKTGHKIKKGTKKVVHKSANATRKGAEKIEDKSAPAPTPINLQRLPPGNPFPAKSLFRTSSIFALARSAAFAASPAMCSASGKPSLTSSSPPRAGPASGCTAKLTSKTSFASKSSSTTRALPSPEPGSNCGPKPSANSHPCRSPSPRRAGVS